MNRVRTLLVPMVAVVAIAALPAVASAFAPSSGGYHGRVDGTINNGCGGNEGEGYFRLKGGYVKAIKNGKDDCGNAVFWDTIIAPSEPGIPGQCNQLNANVSAKQIKVSAKGSFSYTGNEPIGPGGASRKVTFKGTWKSAKVVKGTTWIRGGGCDGGKLHWTMRRTSS